MMTTIEAMKQALDALLPHKSTVLRQYTKEDAAIDALSAAIASEEAQTAEAEPVIAPYITQAHFDRAFPGPIGERTALIDKAMEQAQVFASSWALVGSRFDRGDEIDNANEQKADLRKMVADMLAADAREIQILRAEVDLYRAACDKRDAALDALKKQEPVAYLAWRDGKPCYEGDDAVCEDAVWPVDSDDDRTSTPVYLAAGAQQVAVPQGWTDDQMNRFAWSCINPRLGADSIRERLHAFREQEALRGIVAPQPPQEREPMTDDNLLDAYNELIFAVGNKYENESRHETALRYIRKAEAHHGIGKHYAFREVRVE